MLTDYQQAMLRLEILALASLLVGLGVRGSWRVCPGFVLYLVGVLGADAVVAVSPVHYRWDFWLATEILHAALKLVLVAELAWRMFARLPGARPAVAAALLAVLVATLLAVLAAAPGREPEVVAQTALPRVLHGTAWAFGVLFAATLWFHLPVHALHRAVLRGLVPYLLASTVGMDVLRTFGWGVRPALVYGYTMAYQVVLLYWNAVVWKRPEVPPAAPGVVQALQPWR
jgi:hypothetical protein